MRKFKYHKSSDWGLGIRFQTPNDNSHYGKRYNLLYVYIFMYYFRFILPEFIKPKSVWVFISNGQGYVEYIQKQYEFMVNPGSITVCYGIQPSKLDCRDPGNYDRTQIFIYPWRVRDLKQRRK
jgi:hypothetical protein